MFIDQDGFGGSVLGHMHGAFYEVPLGQAVV